jgi:FixJ family two-component response regulator
MYCSAEAFLDAATASEVTCLVLDIQLDGMSGIELRHHLAASGSNLPTIFMTGCDDDAMRKRAIEAGCVAYLLKPFRADFLLDAIDKAGH